MFVNWSPIFRLTMFISVQIIKSHMSSSVPCTKVLLSSLVKGKWKGQRWWHLHALCPGGVACHGGYSVISGRGGWRIWGNEHGTSIDMFHDGSSAGTRMEVI